MASEAKEPHSDTPQDRTRRRDKHALWRLCGWGGAAAVALMSIAVASQTERGGAQLQLALNAFEQPATTAPGPTRVVVADVAPRLVETEAETRRLAAQVRELTADRERLVARIASLEQNVDDVTGSIKRQAELDLLAPRPTRPTAITPPAPAPVASAPVAPLPAPSILTGPTTHAVLTLAMLARPLDPPPPAWQAKPVAPANEPPADAPPPAVTAALPVIEEPPPPPKPEFGIDLGGMPSLETVEARWSAVKANYGPDLAGLHPLVLHERTAKLPYRLLVGPLPTKAAAVKLCARLAAAHPACRTANFAGNKLAQH